MQVGTGAGMGAGTEEVEAGVKEVEEKGPSGPRARALRVPGNVIEGSSGFQQFFLIYAKLIAGLKDSNVRGLELPLEPCKEL